MNVAHYNVNGHNSFLSWLAHLAGGTKCILWKYQLYYMGVFENMLTSKFKLTFCVYLFQLGNVYKICLNDYEWPWVGNEAADTANTHCAIFLQLCHCYDCLNIFVVLRIFFANFLGLNFVCAIFLTFSNSAILIHIYCFNLSLMDRRGSWAFNR